MNVKRFSQSQISKAIQLLFFGCLSTQCFAADANHDKGWMTTQRYLDPGIWNTVVDKEHCFEAAPQSMLEVEPVVENGQRLYKISQYFDKDIEKNLYAKPLDAQIKDRKIVAKKFCRGIVSISNMELTFPKGQGITDANDGLLLVEAAKRSIVQILEQVDEMTMIASQASSATYDSTQLSNLNTEFSAHLAQINTVVANARFNGLALLDGSIGSVEVPVGQGTRHITIPLSNMSTGSAGLNISTLDVTSSSDAQNALAALNSITAVTTELATLKATNISLAEAAKHDAVTTLVNVGTDEFVVQQKLPENATSR